MSASASPLARLPSTLIQSVFACLPFHEKLHTCSRLNRFLSSCLSPACFRFDHVHLSPPLLATLLASPRLAHRLSPASSLSVERESAAEPALLSLLTRPPQLGAPSHPLSPIPSALLFQQLRFYSQRVDGVGFLPSSLCSFASLEQVYVDTRRYDAGIVLHFSASYTRLHSLKLHALLGASHLEAIYQLPALTSLDLSSCTVLAGPVALHNMPLLSLLDAAPPAAAATIGRLRTLLCPLGEQRVADIVAIVSAQKDKAVLEYIRCDDASLSEQCVLGILAIPTLTALEIHSHNVRWTQPPFAALASPDSPPPSPALQRLRFIADHDIRHPHDLLTAETQFVSSFLARFAQLHVLELSLPSYVALDDVLTPLLQLSALRRLTVTRIRSGAGRRPEVDNPMLLADIRQRSQPAFPFLHSFTCRRIDLAETTLMLLLAHMPLLRALHVLESPSVTPCLLLAAASFCPQLRSVALVGCNQQLNFPQLHRAEEWLLQLTPAVLSSRADVLPPTSLPALRFLSLQLVLDSIAPLVWQRLVGLLAASPLLYLGLSTRNATSPSVGATSVLPLRLLAMLSPLRLAALALPTSPALVFAPVPPAGPRVEYSRQWAEADDARARRERSVMTRERLSEEADGDEQLLFDWMTRHRHPQQHTYPHVFHSDVLRAGVPVSGRQAFFDDVCLANQRQNEPMVAMSVDAGQGGGRRADRREQRSTADNSYDDGEVVDACYCQPVLSMFSKLCDWSVCSRLCRGCWHCDGCSCDGCDGCDCDGCDCDCSDD